MSWCDRLASVPAAGFRLDPHFASGDAILNAVSSILDKEYENDKAKFNVTQHQSFDVQWATEDGFHYVVEPTKVSVRFRHRMRARPMSLGPPVMEMLSKPLPYTELLPVVARRLVDTVVLLPGLSTRSVTRMGIMSTTTVADDEVPPGIGRFIEYIGRPWGGALPHFEFAITAEIGKGGGWTDRCIHTIQRPEDRSELMTVTLDWQRVFTAGHPINSTGLTEMLGEGQRAALRYFEDVGEGKRFDETLIREAAGV